ncbi:MAG TPA: RNA polymerase sigma factor [Thermoanaerobaculia bacterium]|nr:RNA polymerase sigma factor [Thermoanaerobaculia bacterium]
MTDSEVVRRVLDGDPALFETLMRRHNQRMYRAVRAILRSDDAVEDVVQQAYLNAYTHLDQFAGNAQFSTWLTRIAVNEALGHRRRQGLPFEEGEEYDVADRKTPDPERQAAASELRQVMEEEVESLPDAFRVAFVMREVEGLSTTETADSLGISEDLVKTRLHRARAMLRDNLYKRAGITVESLFEFGNARCDRVVNAVMKMLPTVFRSSDSATA